MMVPSGMVLVCDLGTDEVGSQTGQGCPLGSVVASV